MLIMGIKNILFITLYYDFKKFLGKLYKKYLEMLYFKKLPEKLSNNNYKTMIYLKLVSLKTTINNIH